MRVEQLLLPANEMLLLLPLSPEWADDVMLSEGDHNHAAAANDQLRKPAEEQDCHAEGWASTAGLG